MKAVGVVGVVEEGLFLLFLYLPLHPHWLPRPSTSVPQSPPNDIRPTTYGPPVSATARLHPNRSVRSGSPPGAAWPGIPDVKAAAGGRTLLDVLDSLTLHRDVAPLLIHLQGLGVELEPHDDTDDTLDEEAS